jgi:hypothetical protein
MRKAQHPLPNRDVRQHAIDQMGGPLGHSASSAPGTKAATVAREGDQSIPARRRRTGNEQSRPPDSRTAERRETSKRGFSRIVSKRMGAADGRPHIARRRTPRGGAPEVCLARAGARREAPFLYSSWERIGPWADDRCESGTIERTPRPSFDEGRTAGRR